MNIKYTHYKSIAQTQKEWLEMKRMAEELDYDLNRTEDRLKLVENILDKNEQRLINYTSNYYNPHLKKSSFTSESLPVSKDLEAMADYLIYAKEKEERERKKSIAKEKERAEQKKEEYDGEESDYISGQILTHYKHNRNKQREINVGSSVVIESLSGGSDKESVEYQVPKIKVTKADREEFKELRETGNAIRNLNKMIKTRKTITTNEVIPPEEIKKLKRIKIDIQKDEIAMKECLKKFFMFNSITRTEKDHKALSYLRFDDVEIIKVIMQYRGELDECSREDTFGYLKLILMTFDEIVEKSDLEPYHKDIIKLRGRDATYQEIIDEIKNNYGVELTHSRLSRLNNKTIPESLVDSYKKIKEDWVYTYIIKGKYKKCIQCHKIYIESPRNFPKRDEGSLRPSCHKCTTLLRKEQRENYDKK